MIEILYFPFRVLFEVFTPSLSNPFTLLLGVFTMLFIISLVFQPLMKGKK